MKRVIGLMFSVLVLGALSPRAAQAIVPVCVLHNDSVGLTQALTNASNGGNWQILVEQGTYIVPPTGWIFTFGQHQDVSLLGGYVPGTNCQQRHITASPNTAATNTILDGQSQNGAFLSFGPRNGYSTDAAFGTFTMEGFEIRNLQSAVAGGSALFITIDVSSGFTGGITFRYNWVHNAIAAANVVEFHTGGPMNVTNNLFDQNIGSRTLYLLSAQTNNAPWRIVHNTIANNTGEGLLLAQSGSYLQLFNNIMYGNSSFDLDAAGAAVELHADTYGTSTTSGSGVISNHGYAFANTNPGFDPTFHLTAVSNSINSGAAFAAIVPAQDLDGNSRWVGSNPDRGAFETANDDRAYWVVTSALDSSHASDITVTCNPGSLKCTLREAIVRANAYGASTIAFHLTNSCGPQVILLNSPLPNINVPITVDGFSQPGASANTTPLNSSGFLNATSCIVVEGAIGSAVPSAFVVGPTNSGAQLNVQGITFEGFTGAAISLATSTYHWIHGDNFGVETDANPFVFTNGAGVLLSGGATFSTIGGTAPADANVFGRMNDATKAAITISSTTNGHFGNVVANDLIGVAGDGAVVANQGVGIALQNPTTRNEIYGNTVGASALDAITLSGANTNWLHDNWIGAMPLHGINYLSSFSNGGSGIALSNGAAGNAIGAFDKYAYRIGWSNFIENNSGPGVWIKTGAGAGNTVLSNYIGLNGDFAIDFGALGSAVGSPIEALTVGSSVMLGYSTMALNFYVTGSGGITYRVDFYRNDSDHCDASGYGPAATPIATYTLFQPGSGTLTQVYNIVIPVLGGNNAPSYVSGTITNMTTGTTSQISNCAVLPNDRVFIDDFESLPAIGG